MKEAHDFAAGKPQRGAVELPKLGRMSPISSAASSRRFDQATCRRAHNQTRTLRGDESPGKSGENSPHSIPG
jgi:hypothetical protein